MGVIRDVLVSESGRKHPMFKDKPTVFSHFVSHDDYVTCLPPGCNALAVAIGSVHAMAEASAELDIDRLKRIRAKVNLPLVLHGSSGVKEESEVEAIEYGIAKINVATMLNQAFVRGLLKAQTEFPDNVDPRKWLAQSRDEVKEVVRHKIRLFGASGTVRHGHLVSPKTTHRTAKLGGAEE